MKNLETIYNKITCNRNREMTLERFKQAVKEIEKTKHCVCKPEETTGWTTAKCCNICGKPLKGEWCL